MIDVQTLGALIELAQRAPKSKTEQLWLNQLVVRLDEALEEGEKGKNSMSDNLRYQT